MENKIEHNKIKHKMEDKIGVGLSKISEKARRYVNEALDNPWFIHGKFVKRLESDFSKKHGCKFGLVTNSGTSSLYIALQALKEIHGWEDDDEVIVPALTFVATSNIVIHNKLKPIFVDVDKDYYELDPKLIEEKITSRTRAIIPVHLFGQPADMKTIIEIAKKYDLKVIEDSCETMFAHYKGKPVGSFGDIGCFSMYIAHIISAGVGGINTTNNERYAEKMISLMNHGRDTIFIDIGDDKGKTEDELNQIISRRFSFVSVGHSFRVTEMEGALGAAELEDYEENIQKRKKNAQYLIDNLKDISEIQLPKIRLETEHSFMMFPVVLKNEEKTKIVFYLESRGIETRDMLPLVNQPIYKNLLGTNEDDYPTAKWINHNGFYVGCHQHLTRDDLDRIISTIRDYFRQKMDDYKDRPVLVTGGNGFIGSHLVERLLGLGAKVFVLSYHEELNNLAEVKDKLTGVFFCDITKKEEVEQIKGSFEILFHLAADISIDNSSLNPEKTRFINVDGTEKVLNLAMNSGVQRLVYVSTGMVYGGSEKLIDESQELKPSTIYGKTKLEGERLCMGLKEKFPSGVAIPRFFNAYGIRQKSNVAALFIKKALNDQGIEVHGTGGQKRDLINVSDIVEALLLMGSKEAAKNQIVNFGTGEGTKITCLAEKIVKMSKSSSIVRSTAPREGDSSFVCDYSKAKRLFGWEPRVKLENGLQKMIEWAKTEAYFNQK